MANIFLYLAQHYTLLLQLLTDQEDMTAVNCMKDGRSIKLILERTSRETPDSSFC